MLASIKTFKKKTIWAPSEWPIIIRHFRLNVWQNETIILNYNDFLNWNDIYNVTFNEAKLKYTLNCDIKFKSIRKIKLSKNNPENLKLHIF